MLRRNLKLGMYLLAGALLALGAAPAAPPGLELPPDTSLLGHWTLDSGGEDGRTATDSSSYANHGRVSPDEPMWASSAVGGLGGCLEFDGRTRVIVGPAPVLRPAFFLTISAWVRIDHYGDMTPIAGWLSETTNEDGETELAGYCLATTQQGGLAFGLKTTEAPMQWAISNNNVLGSWVHVAGVYDGEELRLYVGGELMARTKATGMIDWSSYGERGFEIGRAVIHGKERLVRGAVDDVRLYGRPLGDDEVQAVSRNTALQLSVFNFKLTLDEVFFPPVCVDRDRQVIFPRDVVADIVLKQGKFPPGDSAKITQTVAIAADGLGETGRRGKTGLVKVTVKFGTGLTEVFNPPQFWGGPRRVFLHPFKWVRICNLESGLAVTS